jgi:hypothetical protein
MTKESSKNEHYGFLLLFLIILVIITAGCSNNLPNSQNSPYSKNAILTPTPLTPTPTKFFTVTTTYSNSVQTSEEKLKRQNIETIKNIVELYHQTHTYTLPDMYACAQMSQDVWNMVETQNINAFIYIGRVDQNISNKRDANHAWVMAEVSPDEFIAMETTGGYLVCRNSSICPIYNPLYYQGWDFNTPKELQDYLKNPSGCPAGTVPGNDKICHPACGANTYCTGDDICIEGQCRGCRSGYIFGEDYQCHLACGADHYCSGSGVCIDEECFGCPPGYYVGKDEYCYKI